MSGGRHSALLAVALLASMGAGIAAAPAPRLRDAGSGNKHRPTPPRMDTELAREIAEHNADAERRKAEKKAAKRARRAAQQEPQR